jgi:hypothetical protein
VGMRVSRVNDLPNWIGDMSTHSHTAERVLMQSMGSASGRLLAGWWQRPCC